MFKSLVQGFPNKKGSFGFIKSVGSPKQADRPFQFQTNKSLSTVENEAFADHPRKITSNNSLSIEITLDKCFRPFRLTYFYCSQTTIQELISFLKRELKEHFIYFKAKNINTEYFLTLHHRKVSELNTKRLELTAIRIKVDSKNNLLANF